MNWYSQGLRAWLLQRMSALYMLVYVLVFVLLLWAYPPRSYIEWRGMMAQPMMQVTTLGFFAALFIHAWVGLRDVIMDYIKPWVLRFGLLTGWGLALMLMGVWAVRVMMRTV